MGGAVSAEGGLADVVCGAGDVPRQSVVRAARAGAAAGIGAGERSLREDAVWRTAEIRPRDCGVVQVHHAGRTRQDRQLVESGTEGHVPSAGELTFAIIGTWRIRWQ